MKIFKLNTSDLHLLLQKADTWAYTKCGASMSGTQLLENFNYLPTLYISFEPLSLKHVPKCKRQGGKKYSPMVKSHPHRERGLLNYLVSQDSSSSMGRVIYYKNKTKINSQCLEININYVKYKAMDAESISLALFISTKDYKLLVLTWLMDWMVLGSGFSDSGALLTLGRGTLRTAGLKSRAVSKSKM